MVPHLEEERGEERVAKKRKADQLDVTNKQPAAPECPVCLLGKLLFKCLSNERILLLNVSGTGLL